MISFSPDELNRQVKDVKIRTNNIDKDNLEFMEAYKLVNANNSISHHLSDID